MSDTAFTVGIVVLSWNRRDRVLDCIQRLRRLDGASITVIVVDNASADDSVEQIARRHPTVVIVRQATNVGFVGGVNAGMQEARRLGLSHAWLLNDDTVVDDAVLPGMLAYAARFPQNYLLSPVIRDSHAPHAVQFANGIIDWRRNIVHAEMDAREFDKLVEAGGTPVLIGTALLINLKVLEAASGFDPRYFAYWEDIDFCVRCARAGFRSSVVSDLTVMHDSPPRETRAAYYAYYGIRNEALFWSRYARRGVSGWRRSWLARALVFLAELRATGHRDKMQGAVDGVWDGLRGQEGQRDASRGAPAWFGRALAARPYLLVLLIRAEFRIIFAKLTSLRGR